MRNKEELEEEKKVKFQLWRNALKERLSKEKIEEINKKVEEEIKEIMDKQDVP